MKNSSQYRHRYDYRIGDHRGATIYLNPGAMEHIERLKLSPAMVEKLALGYGGWPIADGLHTYQALIKRGIYEEHDGYFTLTQAGTDVCEKMFKVIIYQNMNFANIGTKK